MREEVKNAKDAKYKAFFYIYQHKREDRRRRKEEGRTGYDSSSESDSD